MNEQEARFILQAYRPGTEDESDPQFAEALREAVNNPELARWLTEEEAFDRAITTHLAADPPPFGLKTRILAQAQETPARSAYTRWLVGLAGLAALLFLVAQVADFWRRPGIPVPQYASEMVSFVRLAPPLEMESDNLGKIKNWLAQRNEQPMAVPARLAALQPIGCRILSFRGHDVSLICFQRNGNRLAHLFVVDRAALPNMKPGGKPVFANEHGWMTATWMEKDGIYMIALQGGRAEIEDYLPSA